MFASFWWGGGDYLLFIVFFFLILVKGFDRVPEKENIKQNWNLGETKILCNPYKMDRLIDITCYI